MKMSYSFHFSWEKRGKWNEKELFVPLLMKKAREVERIAGAPL
jgi:hypothetical protein